MSSSAISVCSVLFYGFSIMGGDDFMALIRKTKI